jgi:hypothetical protein
MIETLIAKHLRFDVSRANSLLHEFPVLYISFLLEVKMLMSGNQIFYQIIYALLTVPYLLSCWNFVASVRCLKKGVPGI